MSGSKRRSTSRKAADNNLRLSFQPLNFYAITGNTSEPKLYKVQVTGDLQKELSALFLLQKDEFKPHRCDIVSWVPQYKPEADELLVIRSFVIHERLQALVPSAPVLPLLTGDVIERGAVKAVVGVTMVPDPAKAVFLFQAIDARQLLRKSWPYIWADKDEFTRIDRTGLSVKHGLDAVVEGGDLYLNSDHVVRRFLDITAILKEATDQEIRTFLDKAPVTADDLEAFIEASDAWVRRKITSILSNDEVMSMSATLLAKHAKQCNIKLVVKNRRIVLPSDKKALKDALHFLDEDYLSSPLTDSRFEVTGSKRKLPAL